MTPLCPLRGIPDGSAWRAGESEGGFFVWQYAECWYCSMNLRSSVSRPLLSA